MPKVSVIIPTFNRVESLHSAISSVLNQTFQDFEVIVVDDASRDNTREVVDHFHDTRIKYLHHEKNKGEAGARNTGILNANFQYMAFLDDDDEWLPDKLRLQVDLAENSVPKTGLIYSGYSAIDRKSNKILYQKIPIRRGEVYLIGAKELASNWWNLHFLNACSIGISRPHYYFCRIYFKKNALKIFCITVCYYNNGLAHYWVA